MEARRKISEHHFSNSTRFKRNSGDGLCSLFDSARYCYTDYIGTNRQWTVVNFVGATDYELEHIRSDDWNCVPCCKKEGSNVCHCSQASSSEDNFSLCQRGVLSQYPQIPKCSSSLFSQRLKQKFKNHVEGMTSSIWDGTKVMQGISENIKNRDFSSFSRKDEKNMVFWMQDQFSAFSSKFSDSKKNFDGMYRDFKTEHLQAKSTLEGKRRELADVSRDLDSIKTRVEGLEDQKRDAGYNLDAARKSLAHARSAESYAERQYEEARETEEYWEDVCYATIWIPFANIGTCVTYHAERTNAENEYNKRSYERSRAETKLSTVQEFLKTYNKLKTELNTVQNRKSVLQTTAERLQAKINCQEPLLRNFGDLQQKIQLFKTEVDLIQARTQSAEDYRGASMESFIGKLGELFKFIFQNDGFMRRQADKTQEGRITQILKDLSDMERSIKEKKQTGYEALCSRSQDLCNFIWDV